MKATYFEPQIELVRFDCTDIVASSGPSFASFFRKTLNAATPEQTPTVPTDASGELDAF